MTRQQIYEKINNRGGNSRSSHCSTLPGHLCAGHTVQPEPITGNRALGISVGVVTKQLAQGDIKMPWMYLDYLSGDSKAKQFAALQVGLTWSPEFRYGIGIQTGLFYEMSYQTKTMDISGVSVNGSMSDRTRRESCQSTITLALNNLTL